TCLPQLRRASSTRLRIRKHSQSSLRQGSNSWKRSPLKMPSAVEGETSGRNATDIISVVIQASDSVMQQHRDDTGNTNSLHLPYNMFKVTSIQVNTVPYPSSIRRVNKGSTMEWFCKLQLHYCTHALYDLVHGHPNAAHNSEMKHVQKKWYRKFSCLHYNPGFR
ncbi:hypothetical protein L9F63_011990, partial [Diploptera punctata]